MPRLLIVDDEPDIRAMIIQLIDWHAHGLELCGQAIDGREALELLDRVGADLMITDLRMPVMGGLELLAETARRHPRLRSIVLSAYDDFALVKEAFKVGVRDYLLKSELTGPDMAAVLSRLLEERQREQAAARTSPPAGSRRESALRGLLRGDAPSTFAEAAQLESCGLPSAGRSWLVCRGRLEWDGGAAQADHYSLGEALAGLDGRRRGASVSLALSEREFATVLFFPAWMEWEGAGKEAELFFAALQSAAPGACVSLGVSRLGWPDEQPAALLAEAGQALEASFIRGRGRVIHAAALAVMAGRPRLAVGSRRLAAFETLLESLTAGAPPADLTELSLQEHRLHPADIAAARRLYDDYALLAALYLERHGGAAAPTALARIEDFRARLAAGGELADCNRWLRALVDELAARRRDCSALVRRAVRYIDAHRREPLDLSCLAAALRVNASYLSRSFSRQMGRTLLGYVAEVKVKQAEHLLRDGRLRIYEVSDCLGFENPEHFSRLFKKVTGHSPRDYPGRG